MTRPIGLTLALATTLALFGCRRKPEDPYVPKPVASIPVASVTPGNEAVLFPLDKGDQWTYSVSITRMVKGQQQRPIQTEWTTKVVSSEKTAEGTKATTEVYKDTELQDRQTWLSTSKGIYQLAGGKNLATFSPRMPLIVYPVKDSATFNWSGKGPNGLGTTDPFKSTNQILGPQEIDTDMGRMSAYPVESRSTMSTGKVKGETASTVWLSPGVGIVRLRQEALSGDNGYVIVLKLKSKSLMKS